MKFFFLFLISFCALWAPANVEKPVDITSEIEVSRQPLSRLDFENFDYVINDRKDLKLPYTSDALWLRLNLHNPHSFSVEQLISFSSALTGVLEIYKPGFPTPLQMTGSSIPYQKRPYAARQAAFKVSIDPQSTQTFYIKRTSHHNLATRVLVSTPVAFQVEEDHTKAILFFYLGGVFCLIIYNLFIGFYTKDLSYFLYTFFAASLSAAALNSQGFFDAYVFQDLSFSVSDYLMVFSAVSIFASLVFVYRFLNIPQVAPRSKPGFFILSVIAMFSFIYGFLPELGAQVVFGHLIDFTIVALLLFLISCGVIAYRRGNKMAQFFLLSWLSLLIGVIGWFGMTYGLLPNSTLTSNSLIFGNLGEMLVLSLGLAYKINILDQEKKQALSHIQEKERYHRLVKVLSHDVSNAVMIFSGYLRRLTQIVDGPQRKQTVEKLESVIENVKDMLNLVKDEESFQSFKISAVLRPVDLHEVVHEIVAFYEDRITSKAIELKVDVPVDSFVLADRTALMNQVVSNLLANAIKFSYPHSKIIISLEERSQTIVLKIQDFGCGIPAENIQQIFFSKEVISSRGTIKEKGSGLGTTLVKDYMEIFKGMIEVNSVHESVSKASGTLVRLCFPKI